MQEETDMDRRVWLRVKQELAVIATVVAAWAVLAFTWGGF
jgi:hypothetical protein